MKRYQLILLAIMSGLLLSLPWFEQLHDLLALVDSLITGSTDYVVAPETALHPLWENGRLIENPQVTPFYHRAVKAPRLNFVLGATTGSLGKQDEPGIFTGTSGLKVAPVICFESVFGEYIGKSVRKGASLIFIITNDGWWKDTPGYYQHLAYARLRAIETRRSIARSANTGISTLINQRGDLVQLADPWTRTAIKGSLKANEAITFYVRYGDYIGRVSLFVSVMLLLYLFVQKKIKQP